MAFTSRQLIVQAYYLTGIVSRGQQTSSDQYISDGLNRLNAFLAVKSADVGMIPYYQELIFNAVAGQEVYFIPNLVEIETFTFNIGPVRYSTMETSREMYFATGRVDNIESLPYQWHLERQFDGANLYLYFLPQDTYVLKIWGKFSLASTTLNQDLSLIYDPFYIEYLTYGLAEYICEFYQVVPPRSISQRVAQYDQIVRDISPLDLTMQKITGFATQSGFNYADVNIGRGWRPTQ
jgi:hypothetical protein